MKKAKFQDRTTLPVKDKKARSTKQLTIKKLLKSIKSVPATRFSSDEVGAFLDKAYLAHLAFPFLLQPRYVKRWVKEPRFTIPVRVPYIGKSYDHEMGERIEGEFIFGIKTIYTIKLGSKRVLKEVPVIRKFKQETIKFRRYKHYNARSHIGVGL